MPEATYYDAVTRDWGSDKDSRNALPHAQQHETTTTPSDQNHYDAVDEKALSRTLTADSHVHHKVRRPDWRVCCTDKQCQMNGKLFMSLTAMSFLWVGLTDTLISLRLCPAAHLSRHWWCGPVPLVRHWLFDTQCSFVSFCRSSIRSLRPAYSRHCGADPAHRWAHCHCNSEYYERCNW